MNTALIIGAALLIDACLGEPRRWHPLVGFGRLAQAVEKRLYSDSVLRGALALCLLLLPVTLFTALLEALSESRAWAFAPELLLLYLAIGWRSLNDHGEAVRKALVENDLAGARQHAGLMVSRDTAELDQEAIARATVESVLENGNDAVFGALFWFALAGAPGVVLYRISNTLDAMWGYRNPRYLRFGRAAARLDDLLNYLPARLTALGYTLVGNAGLALRCWRRQGRQWKSPNAGPVMAAGAGSLGIVLGGQANYDGTSQSRPELGAGRRPKAADIAAAQGLLRRAIWLWLLCLAAGGWLVQSLFL